MPDTVIQPPPQPPPDPSLSVSPMDALKGLYGQPDSAQNFGQPVLPASVNIPAPGNEGFDRALEAARGRDKGVPAPVAPPAAATPPARPDTSTAKPDPLSWERPRASEARATQRAADWARVNGELEATRRELETFKSGKGAPAVPAAEFDITKLDPVALSKHPEIARLQREHAEFFDIVKHVAVERDPEFVARFEPRREAAIRAAKAVAGGAANDLAKLLAEPASDVRDERIAKLTENFTDGSKRMVGAALQTLASIDIERAGEIATRKATFESRQLDQFKQHEAQQRDRQQTLNRAFDHTLAAWSDPKEGMPFFVKTGNPQWDAEVDATVATARDIFNGSLSPEQLAAASKWAAVAKRVFAERETLLEELQRFRASDTRMRQGVPDLGGFEGRSLAEGPRSAAPTFNPSDPFAGARSFVEDLDAARAADASRGR